MDGERHGEAIRLLLLGVRASLRSDLLCQFPDPCKVEFGVLASADEGEIAQWARDCDTVLLDAGDVPCEHRAEVVEKALTQLRDIEPCARPIVVVDAEDEDTARAAVAAGAWDILTPEEALTETGYRLKHAANLCRLARHAAPAEDEADGEPLQMVGTSEEVRRIFRLIRQVAASDVPVLITGESGTGKELTAQAIHERSLRADGPFITINCAAIPEMLLESELFGHEKGAFTGALRARGGRFETAEGGTLFLDEIGEMAPALQVKLLRFLENHVVERVGARVPLQLDVRVIAATNCDLTEAMESGRFREDLYYRLAVLSIHLPPLRERGEDVLLMAKFYLERYARQAKKPLEGFSGEALEWLRHAPLPGNARELINRVRRAVLVAEGPRVWTRDLGVEPDAGQTPITTLRDARLRSEADCLVAALYRSDGNKTEAARLLGIGRSQLYELMRRHGIEADSKH
jgi:two-component system NtrC family response regulator